MSGTRTTARPSGRSPAVVPRSRRRRSPRAFSGNGAPGLQPRGTTIPSAGSSRRLLLGQAMQGALPPDEIAGVNADDVAAGKQLREDAQRVAIARVVERRHQYGAVRDVEVGIAAGQPLAVHELRGGKGKAD